MSPPFPQLRRLLLRWYERSRRPLPWRATSDPYRIWISEVMLQQTRAATVVPYYERFLARFPDVQSLAVASEPELLAAWAGLGYYSRVRNLRKAAQRISAQNGEFPHDYESIRALPGVGDYTAAAVASIAFGHPYPVLDGNAGRVIARLTNEAGDIRSSGTRARLLEAADRLLDRRRPGEFNQAIMELGATVCLPKGPRCPVCPAVEHCQARAAGVEQQLPVKGAGREPVRLDCTLLVIVRGGRVLLTQRAGDASRLAGFWELPEMGQVPSARAGESISSFRHTITHHIYRIHVRRATVTRAPAGMAWKPLGWLDELPLTTATRKALAAFRNGQP